MKNMIKCIRVALLTSVATLLLAGTATAQNEGTAKGGGQKLIQAKPLKSSQNVSAVKKGDIVTSTCPMCKTTSYKRVETAKGGAAKLQTGQGGSGHCPACGGKSSPTGEIKHECEMCKAETICCVIPTTDTESQK